MTRSGHGVWMILGVLCAWAGPGCGQSASECVFDAGVDTGREFGDTGATLCSSDEDCPDGLACRDGVCAEQTMCESHEDCDKGFTCNLVSQRCVEAECQADEDCGAGKRCEHGVCLELCGGVQCDPGMVCEVETGTCVRMGCTVGREDCEGDADCPAGLFCDPVAAGCTQCPPETFCNMHECFPFLLECRTHSECAEGERCDPDTLRCEPFPESCENDKECEPKYCNLYTHACQDDPFTGDCQDDSECRLAFGDGYYCHPRLRNCVLPLAAGGCYDTADCDDPGLVCDLKSNTCAERGTVCGVDSDCNADHVCINGVCVFQCPVPCVADEECSYGEVCRNACCLEDQSCSSDYDCVFPMECIAGWCTEPLPCTNDDGFEDNDDSASATPLALPAINTSADHPGLVICKNDADWYRVDVPAGSTLTVRIFFTHVSGGDLDMELYRDPAGASVDESTSASDDEEVTDTATADTTYHIYVYGYSGAENVYDLQIAHTEAGVNVCVPDDGFEDNDVMGAATSLPLPADGATDTYPGLMACSGDEDWYAVDLPAGGSLKVRIAFDNVQGDLDMILHDAGGGIVDSSATTADVEEVSVRRAGAAATYFVEVWGYFGDENDYVLEVENPGIVLIDCTDGGNEPNDTAASATPVGAGSHGGLFVCETDPLDVDWYSIQVLEGERLHAGIAFESDDADINLHLYESDGATLVDSSTGWYSDTEQVDGPRAMQDAVYLLKVSAPIYDFEMDAPYTLSVTIDPPILCNDDGFEPNDEFVYATELSPPGSGPMVLCPGDADYFSLAAARGESLAFTLVNLTGGGDLDLYFYDENGVELESATSYGTTAEELEYAVYRDGRYHVAVVNGDPDSEDILDYRLDLSVAGFTPCDNDALEPDDTPQLATVVTDMTFGPSGSDWVLEIQGLESCDPGPEDWFAFDLLQGDRLSCGVLFTDAAGDIDVYLVDANLSLIDSGTSSTDNELVEFGSAGAPSAGRYFLRVSMWTDNEHNVYDLVVTADRPFP